MKKKVDPSNLKPCIHMQRLVSAWSDGELTGVAKWYTERHVHDCKQCQASLPFLMSLQSRLTQLGVTTAVSDQPGALALSEERWTEIAEECERIDQDEGSPGSASGSE